MHIRLPRIDPYGFIVATVGLLVIASSLLRHMPERLEDMVYFIPEGTTRRVAFVVGMVLLYLSEQVSRRKRNAWRVTVTLLGLLVLFSLTHWRELLQTGLYATTLLLFALEKKRFVVQSDADSFRLSISVAALQLLGAMLIFGLIFIVIDQREFGRHLTTNQTVRFTTDALLGKPLPYFVHPTHFDRALIDMLRATGLLSILFLIFGLFRPLRQHGQATTGARNHAATIAAQYSTDSEDFFKLYPSDKHYFFYGDSFVAYTVKNGVALVLDGACGKENDVLLLRDRFAEHCRLNGWHIALIHCTETEARQWEQYGLDRLQIGSEAVIDSAQFVERTKRSKHFRYVYNRTQKDALSVEWWQPPLTSAQLDTLEAISNSWIENGRQEYAFIMGAFSRSYLRSCKIAVLTQANTAIAYTNLIPLYGSTSSASIDHMRSYPEVSSVAMHYLLAACIEACHANGQLTFNLGFVPLAKIETDSTRLTNRILAILRRLGSRFYSSQGLEQFKGKFEPYWSPRYLAYQGSIRQLPAVINTIRQTISHNKTARTRHKKLLAWPIVFMAIAGLCYASFPFAYFLNRPFAFHGLTSALGGDGQPYAWLFNISDVVSSLLSIMVLVWLHGHRKPKENLLRLALTAALFSAVCTALAAFIPMPHQYEHLDGQLKLSLLHHPVIVLHGIASFANSFAFVTAAVLWAIYWRRADGHLWRQIFVVLVLFLSTIGFIIGQAIPGLAGTIQRSFITLYALWFVLLVVDVLSHHGTA